MASLTSHLVRGAHCTVDETDNHQVFFGSQLQLNFYYCSAPHFYQSHVNCVRLPCCLSVCVDCLHFSMVFCLRSAQSQTIQAAHCSPYFLYQNVSLSSCPSGCLSVCLSVCPGVCLCVRRWGFVCAQLEHKLAGCSLPPARAPGFKLQTADRRQWPPSHPTPPYYTCQLRRPEYFLHLKIDIVHAGDGYMGLCRYPLLSYGLLLCP